MDPDSYNTTILQNFWISLISERIYRYRQIQDILIDQTCRPHSQTSRSYFHYPDQYTTHP